MTVKRRPSGQHHGDLRNALEQAALALVKERGPHGFTLAEACRRAGVSVSAPYKHFADREALLASLALKGYEEQYRRYRTAVAAGTDVAEQLAAFAAAYVRFAAEERALFDITFLAGLDKSRHPELAAAGKNLFDMLVPIAGRVTPDQDTALDLLTRIAAAAHGLACSCSRACSPPAATTWRRPHQAAHCAAPSWPSRPTPPADPEAVKESAVPTPYAGYEHTVQRIATAGT
ncbi:TetR/AcrR family transcriptional regulator [Streptomyces sp. 3212.3]|uniref:TetR/AcrR family transcriptional regulator n=1 Tax=Streptomyces sp. 3212.3 TaxID=1938846 RepID=UPI002B4016BF|nr:TetR/AcrR family transcriptional regulator [Streptomyces sp. 3212.3]